MLKENEKRTFWIVVMAVAAVSLVSAWAASFIVTVDYMIDSAEYVGGNYQWGSSAGYDFVFSAAFLLLVFFIIIVAAVAHLATKGRNCKKAKIVWASVIGGLFLLSSIVLTTVYYVVEDVPDQSSYQALIGYITNTLAIAISYEIAFLAQCMLNRKPKQEAAQEPAAQPDAADKPQE